MGTLCKKKKKKLYYCAQRNQVEKEKKSKRHQVMDEIFFFYVSKMDFLITFTCKHKTKIMVSTKVWAPCNYYPKQSTAKR